MPTLTDTKEIEIDFSVYCGICGSGVCSDTSVDDYGRKNIAVTVTCSTCQKRFDELESEIEQLNSELENLTEKEEQNATS